MSAHAEAQPRHSAARKLAQDLTITASGAVTSLLTAVCLFMVEEVFQVSLYTWTWWVFPVGAMLAGFVASGGYYLGAWYFAYRPTRQVLLNMVGVSIGTFFLIHWLRFMFLDVQGQLVSRQISFYNYLDWLFRHQAVQFSFGADRLATGELGAWGYLYALFQIVGFALGGVLVFRRLSSLPYCEKCSRYLSAMGKQTRFTNDPHAFGLMLEQMTAAFESGRLQDVMTRHEAFDRSKQGRKCWFMSVLQLRFCSTCGVQWLGFSAHRRVGRYWTPIKGATFAKFYDEALAVPE